jgi:Cu/Ag efflux pump CusA
MSDWTTDTANFIERSVETLRDRTVEPAHAAIRVVVFGLLAVLIATPAIILAFVGLFRIIVIIEQGYVWAAWLTMGGIFIAVGAFLWTRRNPSL